MLDVRLRTQLDPMLENLPSRMVEFVASEIAGVTAHVERSLAAKHFPGDGMLDASNSKSRP